MMVKVSLFIDTLSNVLILPVLDILPIVVLFTIHATNFSQIPMNEAEKSDETGRLMMRSASEDAAIVKVGFVT